MSSSGSAFGEAAPQALVSGAQASPWRVQLGMLCLVASLEGADMMLLGATFFALERDLGILPVNLASLAMAQALMQAFAGPVWGMLADRKIVRRKAILAIGCTGWGLVTIALGRAQSLHAMITLRGINGALLGTMSPMCQSIVADVTAPADRGRSFGLISCSSAIGAVVTSLIVTPLSHRTILGEPGWRLAFAIIGGLSVLTGTLVMSGLTEPVAQMSQKARRTVFAQPRLTVQGEVQRIAAYFKMPTFLVLVAQGTFGTVPWNALSFTTMFYQLSGFSDLQAASLASLGILCGGIGSYFGGSIGDYLESRFPHQGRPLTAQISVLTGIPIVYVLYSVFPADDQNFAARAILVTLFSLTATWCCAGVNRPILSEIVDSSDRSSIFAWMLAMEGSTGALFGAPLVAYLAQTVFGYKIHAHGGVHHDMQPDAEQARAIGAALSWVCCGFWSVCFVLYSFLHCTYRTDILRVRATYDGHDEDLKPETSLLLRNARFRFGGATAGTVPEYSIS